MSVEFNTPEAITFTPLRFVFYQTPQVVSGDFDSIPQFYLDIADKKNPQDQQRLYMTVKYIGGLPEGEPFTPKEFTEECAMNLLTHIRKAIGSKLMVFNTSYSVEQTISKAAETMITMILEAKGSLLNGDRQDYFLAHNDPASGQHFVRVKPAIMTSYEFVFSNQPIDPDSDPGMDIVASGMAILFDESMFFLVINDYKDPELKVAVVISPAVLQQFISVALIETTVNNSIRVAMDASHLEPKPTYITGVTLNEP